MSVDRIATQRAFAPTTDPVGLARSHERLKEMSGTDPERDLFLALTDAARPCAAEVVGPSGSGKSSCIMRVVGDVASMDSAPRRHEVLLLRAGTAEQFLGDEAAFSHHLIDVVRAQGYRFSDEVQEQLRVAGASSTTVTDAISTHTGKIEAGPQAIARASYQQSLQAAYEQRQYGANPAQARHELEEILTILRDERIRPVVVVDDTDRFADPAGDGLNASAVNGLFNNAVRTLADLHVDFVVAVHPRFSETQAYEAVAARYLRTRLAIPWLALERHPIAAILRKHLSAHGIDTPIEEVLDNTAAAALWGAYSMDRDLRRVLDAADRAARIASDARSAMIAAEHVSQALRELSG